MTKITNIIRKVGINIRRPFLYGLSALALSLPIAPTIARADNIVVESTIKEEGESNLDSQKTRIKASTDTGSFTYDLNHGDAPDEAKLWVNFLAKNGWNVGLLAQGTVNDGTNSFADIGVCTSKTIKSKTIEAFVGPTVRSGVKPAMFYQLAVRDSNGKVNLVLSAVDDKTIPFKLDKLDFRGYFSIQKGNWFGGAGTRQRGLDVTRLYGAGGIKTEKLGNFTNFNYDVKTKTLKFKAQNAIGNPGNAFDISTVNLWNDMKGPGMRDVGIPYFSSFLSKGDITSKIEGTISPKTKDYEFMIGKDFGLLRAGAGINSNIENGKSRFGALVDITKDFDLKKNGKISLEGRYNTRGKRALIYVSYKNNF